MDGNLYDTEKIVQEKYESFTNKEMWGHEHWGGFLFIIIIRNALFNQLFYFNLQTSVRYIIIVINRYRLLTRTSRPI